MSSPSAMGFGLLALFAGALLSLPAAALDTGATTEGAPRAALAWPGGSPSLPSAALTASSAYAARRKPKLEWYGWPIAAVDGAALALTVIWLADPYDLQPAAYGSVALFTLGAPMTHWLHGFTGRGFLSLGVRSVAMVSFMTGAAILIAGDDASGLATAGYVLVPVSAVALVTMSIVDLAVLAFEPAPQPSAVDGDRAVAVTPWLVPHAGTYGLHVSLRL